jgi:acyl-coenzyme A synthetase/AMP-(fatty) acid ligase
VGSIASRRTLDGDVWTTYPGVALAPGAEGVNITAPHATPAPLDDEVEALGPERFRLVGRRTDIIKLGGHRASLAGLNRILLGLEGVEDGFFFLPEAEGQAATSRLLALVVAPGRSADGILQELRGRMHPLFLPRRVILVPALPRNELGKLPQARVLDLLAQLDACADRAG